MRLVGDAVGDELLDARGDVGHVDLVLTADELAQELVAVACRAVVVGAEQGVAVGRHQGAAVDPQAEPVLGAGGGAAVQLDDGRQRAVGRRIVAGGQFEDAVDFIAVGADPGVVEDLGQDPLGHLGVHVGQPADGPLLEIVEVAGGGQFVGGEDRRAALAVEAVGAHDHVA